MRENITLISGFMCAGKTTYGQKLAVEKDCVFVDLDAYIEKNEARSIARIFAEDGEEYFRELETKYFLELTKGNNAELVLALGGGFPMKDDNQRLMKSYKTIFLNTPLETIIERLNQSEIAKRPKLSNDIKKLKELYEKRLPTYMETADVIVS